MDRQFFGYCRRCGRQILLTRLRNNRGWLECDSYIGKFVRTFDRDDTEFFTPEGTVEYGIPVPMDHDGLLGYLPHRCTSQDGQNQAKQRPVNQNL